ncbi:hypothetical protein IPZ70_22430 [Streptomyces polychromogenes]|nr:hypothetical protein [Streptomyces polychromogenes]
MRRRISALGAVLGLGLALPLATGATPAYAQAQLTVAKSHSGSFTRGGQGVYHITVTNSGDTATVGPVHIADIYPQGLTMQGIVIDLPDTVGGPCPQNDETGLICDFTFGAGDTATFDITLDVATDTPCGSITNTVTASESEERLSASASDSVTITGTGCGNTGDSGGTSILPVSLSGLIPVYNNINTNTNFDSPGARNTNTQTFGAITP